MSVNDPLSCMNGQTFKENDIGFIADSYGDLSKNLTKIGLTVIGLGKRLSRFSVIDNGLVSLIFDERAEGLIKVKLKMYLNFFN